MATDRSTRGSRGGEVQFVENGPPSVDMQSSFGGWAALGCHAEQTCHAEERGEAVSCRQCCHAGLNEKAGGAAAAAAAGRARKQVRHEWQRRSKARAGTSHGRRAVEATTWPPRALPPRPPTTRRPRHPFIHLSTSSVVPTATAHPSLRTFVYVTSTDHPPTYSATHPPIDPPPHPSSHHPLNQPLTYSSTHPLTHPPTSYLFNHSLIHLPTPSPTLPHTHSQTHPPTAQPTRHPTSPVHHINYPWPQ